MRSTDLWQPLQPGRACAPQALKALVSATRHDQVYTTRRSMAHYGGGEGKYRAQREGGHAYRASLFGKEGPWGVPDAAADEIPPSPCQRGVTRRGPLKRSGHSCKAQLEPQ